MSIIPSLKSLAIFSLQLIILFLPWHYSGYEMFYQTFILTLGIAVLIVLPIDSQGKRILEQFMNLLYSYKIVTAIVCYIVGTLIISLCYLLTGYLLYIIGEKI